MGEMEGEAVFITGAARVVGRVADRGIGAVGQIDEVTRVRPDRVRYPIQSRHPLRQSHKGQRGRT